MPNYEFTDKHNLLMIIVEERYLVLLLENMILGRV